MTGEVGGAGFASEGGDPLALATAALRQHTDAGWTRIRSSVLASARAAFRPSAPVRGLHTGGEFFVSTDVLVARVQEAVDAVRAAAAERITATTDDAHDLQRLLVEIVAGYGSPLVDLAARVREVVAAEVGAVLGTPAARYRIEVDVHVGDVTADARRL